MFIYLVHGGNTSSSSNQTDFFNIEFSSPLKDFNKEILCKFSLLDNKLAIAVISKLKNWASHSNFIANLFE